MTRGWALGASGLAAVWARENTREALFDAMERKEVYGTTGTRMVVRVFAGWDFTRPRHFILDANGRCKTAVGNTVYVANAAYTNTIGAPLLGAFWKDQTSTRRNVRSTTCA